METETVKRVVYADEGSAIAKLRNNGVLLDSSSKTLVLDRKQNIGIKLWGAVDFLINHGSYRGWVRG